MKRVHDPIRETIRRPHADCVRFGSSPFALIRKWMAQAKSTTRRRTSIQSPESTSRRSKSRPCWTSTSFWLDALERFGALWTNWSPEGVREAAMGARLQVCVDTLYREFSDRFTLSAVTLA